VHEGIIWYSLKLQLNWYQEHAVSKGLLTSSNSDIPAHSIVKQLEYGDEKSKRTIFSETNKVASQLMYSERLTIYKLIL
jgi:hypothetical protein